MVLRQRSVGLVLATMLLFTALTSVADAFRVFVPVVDFDTGEDRIHEYDSSQLPGALVDTIALNGDGVANAIVTDGTDLIVLRGGNSARIESYSTDGTYLGILASLPSGSGIWSHLQRDPAGNLYASSFDRVLKLDAAGNVMTSIEGISDTLGANGDETGRIFVSQRNAILQYDAKGNLVDTTPTDFFFNADIAIDHSGQRMFHLSQQGELAEYDISGSTPQLTGVSSIDTDISLWLNYDPLFSRFFVTSSMQSMEFDADLEALNVYGGNVLVGGTVAVMQGVPEPHTCALLLLGLGVVISRVRNAF